VPLGPAATVVPGRQRCPAYARGPGRTVGPVCSIRVPFVPGLAVAPVSHRWHSCPIEAIPFRLRPLARSQPLGTVLSPKGARQLRFRRWRRSRRWPPGNDLGSGFHGPQAHRWIRLVPLVPVGPGFARGHPWCTGPPGRSGQVGPGSSSRPFCPFLAFRAGWAGRSGRNRHALGLGRAHRVTAVAPVRQSASFPPLGALEPVATASPVAT